MSESSVNVTEGSGKRLHTYDRTVSSVLVQDQFVLHGEPHFADYVLHGNGGTASSTATGSSHLMQIMAGSSVLLRIRRIEIYQVAMATTAAMMSVAIARLTTAGTGGTSLAPVALDPSDSASSATGMVLPTGKGTEAASYVTTATVYMMQTVAASSQLSEPILVFDFDRLRMKPLIVAAGTSNGIAVKNLTAIAGATVFPVIYFSQTSY